MIILTIGDIHYKDDLVLLKEMMEVEIIKHIQRVEPDIIVVLGDTLHFHERMIMGMHTRATHFFHTISQFAPLFVLIGNHDRENNSDFLSNIHPFPSLEDGSSIFVIHETRSFVIEDRRFVFVPYVPPGRFHEALGYVKNYQSADLIFAHQEFKGSTPSGEGDVWDRDDPFVITGHIHDYRRLQSNILYTGTPTQDTYAESTEKSISVFRDDSGEFVEERIMMDELPKRYRHELLASDFADFELKNLVNEVRERDKIVIILRGSKAEIDVIINSHKAKKWRKLGVRLKTDIAEADVELVADLRTFEQELESTMPDELQDIFRMLKSDTLPDEFLI